MPVGICAFPYPMSEPEQDDDFATFEAVAPAPAPEAAGAERADPPFVLVPSFNSSSGSLELETSKIPNAGGPGAPHGGANGYQALVTNGAAHFKVWPPYGGVAGSGCDKRVRPSVTGAHHDCLWATNGGPFDMATGKCNAGMFVSDGKIMGTGGWPAGFGVTANGSWIIGSVNPTVIQQLGIKNFLTGFSWLVRDGQNVAGAGNFTAPRTTIGTDAQGRLLSLEVDGCEGCQWGLTEHATATLLIKQGAKNAINLDGGGSSTVYYNGTVINRPTDTDKWPFRLERAVSYIPCIAKDA